MLIRNFENFHEFFMGAMLIKIVISLRGNESHITKKTNCEKNVYQNNLAKITF